jgi:hypothetical protein
MNNKNISLAIENSQRLSDGLHELSCAEGLLDEAICSPELDNAQKNGQNYSILLLLIKATIRKIEHFEKLYNYRVPSKSCFFTSDLMDYVEAERKVENG